MLIIAWTWQTVKEGGATNSRLILQIFGSPLGDPAFTGNIWLNRTMAENRELPLCQSLDKLGHSALRPGLGANRESFPAIASQVSGMTLSRPALPMRGGPTTEARFIGVRGRIARHMQTSIASFKESILDPAKFRDLVSGRRRGIQATCLRTALAGAALPYALAVRWRNRRYDRKTELAQNVGVPVVSVGNLTLGGTGKTPTVAWIARYLRRLGVRVTIISLPSLDVKLQLLP